MKTAAAVVILLATAASVLAMDGCDSYTTKPGDNYKCGHLCLDYSGDCDCGGETISGTPTTKIVKNGPRLGIFLCRKVLFGMSRYRAVLGYFGSLPN